MVRRQAEFYGRQGAVQLLTGPRTDDRRGHGGPSEQPSEGYRAGFGINLYGQVLVRLDLVAMLRKALRGGSKKLMPSSWARSMMACASSSEVLGPKFIVPRQSRETRRPVRPR
jgi:hypothetical protein